MIFAKNVFAGVLENNMFDSIGLGKVIAQIIYLLIILIAVAGSLTFLLKNKRKVSLIWLSVFLNLLSFLYFLGKTNLILGVINIVVWPLLNIFLIYYYIKKKK